MVVILADFSVGFEMPKQLIEINGEKLIERTIRLLKENGVKDIIITSHDKRFDNLGAKRYEPLNNDFDPINNKGYYLDAYPMELLNEPITFLYGDVYYSENAIKTIIESKTDSVLYFCTYENKSKKYFKRYDEPLGFKVEDYELFKKHIIKVKEMKDKGLCWREPLNWELYRSINELDVNVHKLTNNCVIINDESCDIDFVEEADMLSRIIGGNMKLSIIIPYYETYELTVKILDVLIPQLTDEVELFIIDDGCKEKRLDKYNKGDNINIIHLKENVGGASATNEGLRKAVGEYIALIDSDDMIATDYVETLLKYIDEREEDVIFFDWQDMNTGSIVRHPNNYAPWKAIYKRNIIPFFRDGWIYAYDVPFQEDLSKINYTRYYIDKILYFYNSNRPGNLTTERAKILEGKND